MNILIKLMSIVALIIAPHINTGDAHEAEHADSMETSAIEAEHIETPISEANASFPVE